MNNHNNFDKIAAHILAKMLKFQVRCGISETKSNDRYKNLKNEYL